MSLEDKIYMRKVLFNKLKEGNFFWSYDMEGVEDCSDDMLILKTLLHLDMKDIQFLFYLFPEKKVKKVWREQMAIQGDYYRTLNLFLAWYYFGIKKPERYLKMIETRHLNRLLKESRQ